MFVFIYFEGTEFKSCHILCTFNFMVVALCWTGFRAENKAALQMMRMRCRRFSFPMPAVLCVQNQNQDQNQNQKGFYCQVAMDGNGGI